MERFQNQIEPQLKDLATSVIHNDANDNNLVVSEDLIDPKVRAIIDFGDAIHTQVINDVAVAIAYAVMGKNQVLEALACAVNKFVSQTLPQMDSTFSARDLWSRGLALSYRSELRTEEPERAAERLFDANPEYYRALTQLVLETLSYDLKANAESETYCSPVELPGASRLLNAWGWHVRILQGKLLSVLRLLKGLFTFEGGIDYILWKIERHSGVHVEVGATLRRFPPVAMVVIFWRLYRQDAFR